MCSCRARPRSCTPTSTRSTRRSSSATTRGLRGRPVIVGGGVVLAASYEAKACGVRTAMGGAAGAAAVPRRGGRAAAHVAPTRRRARPCSRSSTTPRRWSRGSRSTRRSSTSAGCGGSPARRARSPRGCAATCASGSACRSPSGSRGRSSWPRSPAAWPSPTACSSCRPDGELAFLHPLPVERLWGVGPVTAAQAARARDHDGRRGRPARRGGARRDARPGVRPPPARARPQPRPAARCRSAGGAARSARSARSAAAPSRPPTSTPSLVALVDRVTRRMRAADRVGRTVVLRLRFDDFTRATRSHTLPQATARHRADPRRRARAARRRRMPTDRAPAASRSSASRSATSTTTGAVQLALPLRPRAPAPSTPRSTSVRDRFGSAAVTRAVLLGRDPGLSVPMLPD